MNINTYSYSYSYSYLSSFYFSFLSSQLNTRLIRVFVAFSVLTLLQACGSGSGAETIANQDTSQQEDEVFVYQGEAPLTEDVQNFKLNVYDNLVADRCGTCHGTDQAPIFLSRENVNLAYQLTNTESLVDFAQPSESRLVTKVAGGHNCWTDNDQVCADIMTNYIEAWALNSENQSTVIVLTEPVDKEPGSSKSFPAGVADFQATVYPTLVTYCADCHSDTGSLLQQQPYFASDNVELAYDNSKARIDLENPQNSRFVVRIRSEFHNCWSDCADDSSMLQAAIQSFSDGIDVAEVDQTLLYSKALGLFDGVIASSGGRVETNIVALYEFKTGDGFTAFDTSGVDPATDLQISGPDVSWVGSYGLRFNNGKAQASTASSKKIHDSIASTGEYSIEAWVIPANVSQDGPAAIINYSGSDDSRNFGLGQTLYNYNFKNRSTVTDVDGGLISTPDADEVLQATLQHVVLTYDPINARRIYVNGVLESEQDTLTGGLLTDWDDSFAFVIGNEVTGNNQWQGSIRLLAVYNRAIDEDAIVANFDAGVGQKYFLLFGISDLISVDNAFVVFEVQQFDDYGYLFNQPFFYVVGGDTSEIDGIDLEGMRIGINGKEVNQGQAFANIDTQLSSGEYADLGQPLSPLGTIIAVENGAETDEFFLTFDQIGSLSYVRTDDTSIVSSTPEDSEQSDIGIKTFEEIDATLSSITGVPRTNSAVYSSFQRVKQQLPTSPSIQGFLSAHQMGVTQLAVEYCNELTAPANGLRDTYFSGFDFTDVPSDAFETAEDRQLITAPLLEALLAHEIDNLEGSELSNQADPDEVEAHLDGLFDTMEASCGSSCTATDTRTIVTSICAAATGSALMLLQ